MVATLSLLASCGLCLSLSQWSAVEGRSVGRKPVSDWLIGWWADQFYSDQGQSLEAAWRWDDAKTAGSVDRLAWRSQGTA
jgi:hypothetical protein